MKRAIYCITLLVFVIAVSITSSAESTARRVTLEAVYNDIKVVVDGKEVILKDTNGKPIEPFISGGVTYLPLRACVNAITGGTKEIEWDQNTFTVYIGDRTSGKVGLHDMKIYKSDANKVVNFTGIKGSTTNESAVYETFSFINRT